MATKKKAELPKVPKNKKKKSTRGPGRPPGSRSKSVSAKTALNKHLVVEKFIEGKDARQISLETPYTYSTVVAMLRSESFKKLLDTVLEGRRQAIGNRLEYLAEKALNVHEEVMDDVAHRSRLAAAEGVLDRIGATQKGSLVRQQVTQVVDDFSGRSQEDLEFYIENGYFPEEAPDGKAKAKAKG